MNEPYRFTRFVGKICLIIFMLMPVFFVAPAFSLEPPDKDIPQTANVVTKSGFSSVVRIFPDSGTEEVVFNQGQAFLVSIEDPERTIASIRAQWNGQAIPCFPGYDRLQWQGLGGVHRETEPGVYVLDVIMETTYGSRSTARKSFRVEKTEFSHDELTVAPEMAKVPESIQGKVDDDRRAFGALWSNPSYGRLWEGPFSRPLPGRITSTYGELRIFNQEVKSVHGGVDLSGAMGVQIKAAAAGRVVLVRSCHIEGNTLVIDHGSGVFTYYCHLSEYKAFPGDMVKRDDVIGLVGSTGRVTGPHLHWGCRIQGVRVDALSLLALSPFLSSGL